MKTAGYCVTCSPPCVMHGSRKTWDLSPPLQELWKEDSPLDKTCSDLTTDSDEELSLHRPLQSSLIQCGTVHAENTDAQSPRDLHLVLQAIAWSVMWRSSSFYTLQEKVCQYKARLRNEEATCRLKVQVLRKVHDQSIHEKLSLIQSLQDVVREQESRIMNLENAACSGSPGGRCSSLTGQPLPAVQKLMESNKALQQEKSQLQEELLNVQERLSSREMEHHTQISKLQAQVEDLKEKLLDQAQEVNRLRSELGATDLEKHLEILVAENDRLKQELNSCQEDLQELRRQPLACSDCEVTKERLCAVESELEERKGQLSELQLEVKQKTQQLAELERHLSDSMRERAAEEEWLNKRLREFQQAFARQSAFTPQSKIAEVESLRLRQALMETQTRNQYLQEQMGTQRQLLKELEQQLQESQQGSMHLRAQVCVFLSTGVHMNLLTLRPALRTLTNDYNGLKQQVRDFPFLLQEAISQAKQEIGQAVDEVTNMNRDLLRKYKEEMHLRKKLHNELVKLKGNIRVLCRVRPIKLEDGDGPDACSVVSVDPQDDCILHMSYRGKATMFEMDKVFPPQASQEEVFQEVQSLITSCIDGFNVCIFAYGQTGSGKTYTMQGPPENPGINQRALCLLFSEVAGKAPDWDYTIKVSMVEIYNEALRDLLGKDLQEKLEIKLSPDGSGQLYVPGLTEFTVTNVKDINRESSLSMKTCGKLNLVDLAGSERVSRSGAEGSRLRETQCINKSLSALGDVIYALRSASPMEKNVNETVCSLKFAQRVRSVELGPVSRKIESFSSPQSDNMEVDSPPVSVTSQTTHSCNSTPPLTGRMGGSTRKKFPLSD
nr:PREDICTED: kinesin-like protein KIFC3 [Latimeria chalumnae]|eukprot:XP_014350860.1 PREDICTED: kinesin-like protein KIFC3 [Latimeria chalumnae]